MKPIKLFLNPLKPLIVILVWVMLATGAQQAIAQTPAIGPDIVIKISRLSEALDLVDKLAADRTAQGGSSPTAIVRGSLMGTRWIDPDRPMIIAINLKEGAPKATALIPYTQPNPDFQSAYNAKNGPNYYVIALPQDQGVQVSATDEVALLAASATPQQKLLSVHVALRRLIEANTEKIDQLLTTIEPPPEAREDQSAPPITSEETREVLNNAIGTLRQVDTFSLGFDLNDETLSIGYQLAATPGSQLAGVFTAGGKTFSLGDLPMAEQMAFTSRSYNLSGMLDLMGANFGQLYRKMGIDFAGLEKISKSFTGEMLGGMTLGKDRIDFEFMAALSEQVSASDFLEKEYIPWLLEYGRQMSRLVQKTDGEKATESITLTPESTVNGHRILGCRVEIPTVAVPGPAGVTPPRLPITEYEMRMATTDRVLVVASDDARVGKLLEQAGQMQAKTASGPLMTGEVDLAGYLETLRNWAQAESVELPPLPKLGKMLFEGDMGNGQAEFEMSVRLKDVKGLINYTAALAPLAAAQSSPPDSPAGAATATQKQRASAAEPETKPQPGTLKVPPKDEGVPVKQDAEYWTTRAYLCTTYGNDEAAIRFFKKAIALSPRSSNLYFQMGISYGELGYYQAAINAINKAIELGGEKGLYYYGRGRVLLLSGKNADGMVDIEKAAAMGDLDAIKYLEGMAG